MAEAADLLTVLHQIDSLRGKICETCNYWQRRGIDRYRGERIGHCTRGHHPYGSNDGCDDWQGSRGGCRHVLK